MWRPWWGRMFIIGDFDKVHLYNFGEFDIFTLGTIYPGEIRHWILLQKWVYTLANTYDSDIQPWPMHTCKAIT